MGAFQGVVMKMASRVIRDVFIIAVRRLPVLALWAACLPALAASTFDDLSKDYLTLWRRGEYAKALQSLDALIKEQGMPQPVKWSADRAELLYETGRLDEAIADLERIESRYSSPVYLLRLALLYRERGRKDDYLQTLGRAAERARILMRYSLSGELVLTQGRIAELQGQNPKIILNSLYGWVMENAPDYAPGFIAAGDLAFRKWDYQLAAEYYEKALKIEPENQAALAGLAECYWKSADARLEPCLERLLALNPNHPRARAIQIEQALDVGKAAEALRLIDAALTINPNSLRMLSLQAAAWFLLDNATSLTLTQARALRINPYGSEVFSTPGRIASRHYRFREAADFHRRALEIDPDDIAARALYAFDLLRLGEEDEGRRQLEKAFEADRYNVTVFNMLNLLDSLKRFEQIERGPFALQLPRSEAYLLADDAFALLDEAHRVYSQKYGVELETPVRVQIFDNHDDFMVRSVGLPGSVGHLGICFGRLVTMDSPSARPKGEMNWRSVLWHEFVHVVTLQKTHNRIPRWLSEGISVFEETQRDTAWGQRLSLEHKALLETEGFPGLADLERYFTTPKTIAHLMFGYLVAYEFVRFYVERFGHEALRNALDQIGKGRATLDALEAAAGTSRQTMDGEFRAQFKKRMAPLDNLPSVGHLAGMKPVLSGRASTATLAREAWSTLPSPFTDALREAREALAASEWDRAEAALKKADALFPDYAGEESPLRQLIALYERQNRRDELRAALRRQVARHATDFASCRKLALLLEADGAATEVLQMAERALAVDPFNIEMRQAALKACRETGRTTKALVLLDQLVRLDRPRAVDYRLQRIDTLCRANRWDEAKQDTLRLLEEMPYYWEAQQRLLRIVERDKTSAGRPTTSAAAPAAATAPIAHTIPPRSAPPFDPSMLSIPSIACVFPIPFPSAMAQPRFGERGRRGPPDDRGGERGFRGRGGYDYRWDGSPLGLPQRDIFPGNIFTFCRLRYDSARNRWGGGWQTDYNASDINFSIRLEELTTIRVNRDERGRIKHAVVRLTDDELFNYPFLYMIEPGALVFSDEEVERLRMYLLRGGFLMVDDFWGEAEWENFAYEFSRVFPPEEYPMQTLPLSHEIFHCVFDIKEYPQVPSVHAWLRTGLTYERQDAQTPHFRGVFDKRGRLMAIICHNTDLGDGWERENWDEEYFREFSAKKSYPMGINIVVYAMTH
ncbi:MAG: DUF4159 domain-containing protein [Candidatus Sumerlaeia bacterium]|nr:DUF4159 domain-containing protein [Candidatus Sumerlaeia bacterium]